MADDDSAEDKTDESTDEGAREEASEESSGSEGSEGSEESDAKSGENSEDQTPKSEIEDPEFGKKDDEPANEIQMKYLKPLAEDMGEEIPDDMSEADAASKINEMQEEAAS